MRFDNLSEVLNKKGFDFHTIADEGSKTGCSWYINLDKNNIATIYINRSDTAIIRINNKEQTVEGVYIKQVIDILNFAKACFDNF